VIHPAADRMEEAKRQLTQTSMAQPALFVLEYALARLWMSWGIRPQAMLGHGIGEYVAACLAGVFSLQDALAVVAARGKLVQKQPAGAMLAIPLPEQEVKTMLGRRLSLAAVNGPDLCVASGQMEAIETLERKLEERGVISRRLDTSHAFHSEMMDPVLHWLTAKLRKVDFHPPQIPYLANLTGKWVTAQEATDPRWWAAHLRQTVRFADCLAELGAGPHRILLEVGPGQTLTALAQKHPAVEPGHVIIPSLNHPQERPREVAAMLDALGRLWLAGVTVDWAGFHAHEKRRRLPLPTYPFERKRFWVEPGGFDPRQNPVPIGTPLRPTETTGAPHSQQAPQDSAVPGVQTPTAHPKPVRLPDKPLDWQSLEDIRFYHSGLGMAKGGKVMLDLAELMFWRADLVCPDGVQGSDDAAPANIIIWPVDYSDSTGLKPKQEHPACPESVAVAYPS